MEYILSSLYEFIVFLLIVFLPGIILCVIGLKVSNNMKNGKIKSLVRGGIIAITLTPSIYGHAGVYPAIVVFFLGLSTDGYWKYSVIPILVVWIVSFIISQSKTRNNP